MDTALMKIKYVGCYSHIDLGIIDVSHYKNAVKTRKDGCLQFNLLRNLLQVIVSSKNGIGSS